MAYRNIKNIVAESFEGNRDLRINHTIEQRGASHLISAVYDSSDAEERKFYRKPKLAEGEETKLAILYGETMITPYIIDVGISTGTNDPASITRTIRFIAGDGETEGVVIGPNGSVLENVYLGSAGEQAQPVINDDGKPSTKDILLGAALGGLVQSIPSIWDAITDDTPDADKLGEIDPLTGEKILSKEEKKKLDDYAENLKIEELANVCDDTPADGYILVFDNCLKEWCPKHINSLMTEAIQVNGGVACVAPTMGTPGTSGTPAIAATEEVTVGVETVKPDDSLQKEKCVATDRNTLTDMVELVDISDLADNQFAETRDCFGTDGIKLHFMFEGMGKTEEWTDSNAQDTDSDMTCFIGEQTGSPHTVSDEVAGTVNISVCLVIDVCGSPYAFYKNEFAVTELSETDFTRHIEIKWEDTDVADLFTKYGSQVDTTVNILLRRMDGKTFGGCPTSTYPAHYQGCTLIPGELWTDVRIGAPSDLYPHIDAPEFVVDDGVYPDRKPIASALGPDTCPVNEVIVIPASPAVPAVDPILPVAGDPGTCGDPGTPEGAPEPDVPTLVLNLPVNTKYCEDEDNSNPGFFYDKSDLATIKEATSDGTNTAASVTVNWIMVKGKGTFVVEPGMPAGITSTVIAADNKTVTLTGPGADMPAASLLIKMQADDAAEGELNYKITLENDTAGCTGALLKNLPCSVVSEVSESACAEIEITADLTDTGTVRIYSTMPDNTTDGDERKMELTSSAVSKSNGETLSDYVTAIAANMQNNINAKNALVNTDEAWLPLFTVTALNGTTVKVCAPKGATFNKFKLSQDTSGGVGIGLLGSILDFFGGTDRTVSNTPSNDSGSVWSTVGDVLLNIAGNVAGIAVANMLFNDASTLSLTIPEADKDVTVTFLYKGRKVKMPSAYDQATRSGTPDFNTWGGDWDSDTLTKVEWSDNPAWCLLDYIENRKFGLGEDIILSTEQKNQLVSDIFDIAAYCDEVVDGNSRFSLNTAITDGTKIQILEQLCSVFFGSFVFYKGGLRVRADKLDNEIKLLVNQSNAGEFTYEHATLKSFINKVVVTYVDPNSFYIEKTVTAENQQGIDKYGEKAAQVFGFGITNEDQALRYANWVLYSEIENALTVSYKGGWDHYKLVPGDIIQFEDSNERGARLAGRCTVSGSNVTFDSDCVAVAGDQFSITEDDGSIHETTIASVTDGSNITLTTAPSGTVVNNSTFIIGDQLIGQQLFRVVKVDETADGVFNTTLQLYNSDKYNKIKAVNRS